MRESDPRTRLPEHGNRQTALTGHTWRVESRVAEATRRQQLCATKAAEVSFTRFGALGARAPEHAESAPSRTRKGASGVNRHSDKHAPRHIPEAQDAFKVLMIHWILQVARRIAFRCVLHRCGSQDIRR